MTEQRTFKKKDPDEDNIVVVSSEYFFPCPVCETQLETKKENVGKIKICKKCFTNLLVPEEDGYSIPYGVICLDLPALWRNYKKPILISVPFAIIGAVFLVLGIASLWAVSSESNKAFNRKMAREVEKIEEAVDGDRELSKREIKSYAAIISQMETKGLNDENVNRISAAKRKILDLWTKKESE